MKLIPYAEFKNRLVQALGDEKSLTFTQTQVSFYAHYRPKFPEKTAADFLVIYDCIKGAVKLIADTACVPIVKEYDSFDELETELVKAEV